MRMAVAEQPRDLQSIEGQSEIHPPLVIAVPEMSADELIRRRAGHFIGEIAVTNEVELFIDKKAEGAQIESLRDAVHLAAEGDDTARKVIEMNVRTDVIERTFKAGHVKPVPLSINSQGDIHQHGHSLERVQANSLIFASNSSQMAERVEAETHNAFRLKELHRQGLLEEYSFVVISRAADNMSQAAMANAGFFVDTMSTAIQVTTAKNSGLQTESAFVAGIKKPGQPRHDQETINALGAKLGVDLSNKSAAELIGTPLLIHNSLLPNGVVDLVKLYDDCAGGTFFGEDKLRQDYVEFLAVCQRREATFEPKVQEIVEELIAKADMIQTQVEATQWLAKLSGEHMAEKATEDESINPLVFGTVSAGYIVQARLHRSRGNFAMARAATRRAKATQKSTSCPGEASEEEFDESGIASAGTSRESWHGGKKYRNSKCRSCKEVKSEVGACHICKDCVDNPTKRKREYDAYLKESRVEAKVVSLDEKHKQKEERFKKQTGQKLARTALAIAA